MIEILRAMVVVMGVALALPWVADARRASLAVPVECSRGPRRQSFEVTLRLPSTASLGERFAVRIDGSPSEELDNVGLKYIHDMQTRFHIPTPFRYVAGSLHTVPDTGTRNVRPAVRVWHEAGSILQRLPAHVERGSRYTPPSLAFELEATGEPGDAIAVALDEFRVQAEVFLLGNIQTVCTPAPRPYPLAKIRLRPAE